MKTLIGNNDVLPSYNKETKIATVKYRNFYLQIDNMFSNYLWKYALPNHEYYHTAKYDINNFSLELDCDIFKLKVDANQLVITLVEQPTITFSMLKDVNIDIDKYNIVIKNQNVFIKYDKVKKFYYNANLNKDHFRIFNFLTMSFHRKAFVINTCLVKYSISNNFKNNNELKHKIILNISYKNNKILIIKQLQCDKIHIQYKWNSQETRKLKYLANIVNHDDHILVKIYTNKNRSTNDFFKY